MAMTVTKVKNQYLVKKEDKILLAISTYHNPAHLGNCYLDFDVEDSSLLSLGDIFQSISKRERKPLQVMCSSKKELTEKFLELNQFQKVRECYEMEISRENLMSYKTAFQEEILILNKGNEDYFECCKMLFYYYSETHEAINPLSLSLEEFSEDLPKKAYSVKKEGKILHAIFVEEAEIAYVVTDEPETFKEFAFLVVETLFEKYPKLYFEADSTDKTALLLKSLFSEGVVDVFDTWIKYRTDE